MQRYRIEYDGAIYHVIQRSANREEIFGRDSDKRYLVKLIADHKVRLDFRLFGYVIMKNHYHFMIQTSATPLSKIMHKINFLYGGYYNYRHERHGHVFGGRYKAGLIVDEGYFFAVLRYIHQNPLRAGICESVSDYPWSSNGAYYKNDSSLVDIDFILDMLSPNRDTAIRLYRKMMGEKDDTDFESMKVIGDGDYSEHLEQPNEAKQETRSPAAGKKGLHEILSSCGAGEGELDLIRSGSRKRNLGEYKKRYALSAIEEGYTLKEIGSYIKISDAAVSKLLNR